MYQAAYGILFSIAFVLLLCWLTGELSARELRRPVVYLILAWVLCYLILPQGGCPSHYDEKDDEETIPDLM